MESLRLKSKLLRLLMLVGVGLVFVALIGFYHIHTLKRQVDTLYFGSMVPLSELTTITDTYHHQLESTVYRWKEGVIRSDDAARNITLGLDQINQTWNTYLTHHKRPEEMAFVDYTQLQIESMERYFLQIRELMLHPGNKTPVSVSTLSENVTAIHSTVHQLIAYENASARYEHGNLLSQYHNSLIHLTMFVGMILIMVMFMAWKIFTRIEWQQHQLIESADTLKHLNLKLEQASYTDSLTSLFNRRYFNLLFDREFKRALRGGKPFVFMMLDIDYFKQYNDTYGHLQGDQALQAVAKVLRSTLQRPGDYPFRLGGEEFGVIITDTDCHNAKAMGEKIRSGVEALKIEHKGSKVSPTLSISIGGICITPNVHIGDEALIHAADTNLYAAKERGRNQVVFSNKL